MPKSYSIDLRRRVVQACDDGDSPEAVASRFSVAPRTVYNWLELCKETGDIAPRPGNPGPTPKLAPYIDNLQQIVRNSPDKTLDELRAELPVKVAIGTLHNALCRLGLPFKKRRSSTPPYCFF